MKDRFSVYIEPHYDMVVDNKTKQSYGGSDVVDMLNEYDREVKKLSKALMRVIDEKMKLKDKYKRWEHEVFE